MPVVVGPGPETMTAGVQASLLPWGDYGSDWQNYNAALAAMFEQVFGIVWDQGSADEPDNFTAGWSTLLDPNACPDEFLPYLGMFVGVFIPIGTDPDLARSLIKSEQGFQRGQGFGGVYDSTTIPAGGSIVLAAQRHLSGTQSIVLVERTASVGTPDAYHFILAVRPEQLLDATGLTNAVNAVKPAGIQWTLVQTDGWTWAEADGTWNADTMTWNETAIERP